LKLEFSTSIKESVMKYVQRNDHRTSKRLALAASAVLGLAMLGMNFGAASADPPSTPATPATDTPSQSDSRIQTVSGEVQAYNLDPRGNVSSIVLKDGDHLAQFNLPPDAGSVISAAAPVGQTVQASGIAEVDASDRAIYRLTSLTGANNQKITLPSRESRQQLHTDGTIKQLNYGRRGELDGAILDNGDFVFIGPRSAAQLKLTVGEKITADGLGQMTLSGHNVIMADKVNDTTIEHPRFGGPGAGPDGMHGPHGPHGDNQSNPDQPDDVPAPPGQ
jgi:hypothetical protein